MTEAGRLIYVDKDYKCPGTGGSQDPYCSVAVAVSVALPGDDIRIRKSLVPYDESARPAHSGTAADPITIEADDPAERPVLRDGANGAATAVLVLRGVDYWTVKNLLFDGTDVFTSLWAIWAAPAAGQRQDQVGIRILGNIFKNWGGSEAQEDSGRGKPAAVVISGGWRLPANAPVPVSTTIRGNLFDGNRLGNIEMLSTRNSLIEGNEFRNTRCGRDTDGAINEKGIHFVAGTAGRARGDIVRENTFHDFAPISACRLTSAPGTWPLLVGVWCDVDPSDGTVVHNRFWNIGDADPDRISPAIAVHIEQNCHGWTVDYNTIHDIGWSGIRHNPTTTGEFNKFFNNTIYNTGVHGIELGSGGAIVERNIVSDAGTAQIMTYARAVSQNRISIDHNDYWSDLHHEAVGQWGSAGGRAGAVLDLAGWRQACGCDRHSLNVAPRFAAAAHGDFRLSPATTAGVPPGGGDGQGEDATGSEDTLHAMGAYPSALSAPAALFRRRN